MANPLEINLDISELERFLDNIEEFGESIDQSLKLAMRKSVDLIEAEVKGRTPVNFGKLRQSITTDVSGFVPNIKGRVFTPLIYGLPVERGRKPGRRPPIGPIELWVVRKGLVRQGDEAKAVAFLIARAIGARGTRAFRRGGVKMFERGLRESTDRVIKLWESAIDQALTDFR